MLSLQWYSEQMTKIAQEFPTTRFLVFSDETDLCKSFFDGFGDVTVLDCGPFEAFVAMSMCDSGVLSPSSLSWWAAKLASLKSTGPFIAPRYWFWFRHRKWVDSTLRDSRFLTLEEGY